MVERFVRAKVVQYFHSKLAKNYSNGQQMSRKREEELLIAGNDDNSPFQIFGVWFPK
jgi:hypothetical protein